MQLELVQVLRDPGALFRRSPEPSYPDLPVVGRNHESNVPGVYLVGEVAGTPLLKLGLNEGYDVVEVLAPELSVGQRDGVYDLVIVGAGPAGFAAMVRAKERGLSAVCLEADCFASTVVNMYKGKLLFAEPTSLQLKGSVWFEECRREELLERWRARWRRDGLDIREHERVVDIERREGRLEVVSERGRYPARKVVLAIGKAGNPRKARVPGEVEHAGRVRHVLTDPELLHDQRVVIYGGGDVALEAALALCDCNEVVVATIDEALVFPKKRNREALEARVRACEAELHLQTSLKAIHQGSVTLETPDGTVERPADLVFEMIGAELPLDLFRRVGIRLRSQWTLARKLSLAALLVTVYLLYAVKNSVPVFPFTLDATGARGWLSWLYGYGGTSPTQQAILSHLDAATAHIGLIGHNAWYALLYTIVVGSFGLRAARRWGRDDPHQRWRYASIVFFQVFFFVAIEYGLVRLLGLIGGPEAAKQYWRGWGLAQPFPLFYNVFFWWYKGDPFWLKAAFIGSGLFLTFVAIPLFVRWQGMRFCTWICGCGGLAETLGDQWRHLAPKGARSRLWEFQATLIMLWAFGSAAAIVLFFHTHGDNAAWKSYEYVVDFWLVAVLPVGFYPFFGGKMWCRYWCPLANYMKLISARFGTLEITSNDKCISCGQCSKYCQVGVDVMAFAKDQETFDNANSSCIHCGICVTVCPVDVLSFHRKGEPAPSSDVRHRPHGR